VRNHLARFLKPFLLSVIFGVLIGFARYELPIYSRAENRPGITASEFVNLVRTDPSRAILQGMTASKFASLLRPHGADAVRDLTIYPTLDGKNYVRGTIVISANNLQPFQFNANNPFEFGSTIPGHDIRDFLAKECPKLSYRYAWWDSTTAQVGIWGASATLLLGVVFAVASLFVSGGEKGVQISLLADSKAPAAAPSLPAPAADLSKIEALNAMIEQSLGITAEQTLSSPTAKPAEAPVRSLSHVPDTFAPPEQKTDPKEYRGQYYPVSRGRDRNKH